ncbi:hypothetical protein DL89DRAFT_270315 [Linderina pennispora]|uniref:Uncharacterized protein n=1 Tax=Linderina pennispora TaxID=61395 RepID=A0A1Y1VXW9_9FUNG|nr:uncharacterized protein DL89DRAFT_270315 [Linderina pennispora]ORX66121.1 hypothetical protein DL89DRAFT_270315 [Linderina pennispora]
MSAIEWLMKRTSSTDLLPDGTHVHTTNIPDLQKKVYLWIGVVDIFLFTISTLLFVYRGRRTLDINAHAVLLTSIGSFTILVVNTCFLFQFVWPGNFPCFLILWCAYPGVMLWMSCTLARAMRLYILSYRNTQKLKERNKVGQMTAAQLYGKGAVQDPEGELSDAEKAQGSSIESSIPKSFYRRRTDALGKWWAAEKSQITERRLVWYVLFATLFTAIVCSIIQALTKDLAIVPMMYSKCPVGVWEYFPLYAMIALYCVVLTPVLVYHIWPIKDAVSVVRDPFWDSFLWCSLLFNLSQITSVIIPLVRSYRQSDAFTWSDNPGRTASKELFYRVLNHPELFEKLKIYSAANFCTEITLFLEEYQVLKANVVRFYNIGEPGFDDDGANDSEDDDDDDDDDDDGLGRGGDMSASRPNLTGGAGWTTVVTRANNESTSHANAADRSVGSPMSQHSDINIITRPIHSEKDALRSNHDTIISVGDARSSDEDYSDQAAMVPSRNSRALVRPDVASQGIVGRLTTETSRGIVAMTSGTAGANGSAAGSASWVACCAPLAAAMLPAAATMAFSDISNGGSGDNINGDNSATLAGGGATIGKLPVRRNSRGEDIMVLSHVPPFTPVRYTILSTLMQTPAGLGRQGNITTFKTLPFALRGDYYGFYSTFIADGATLQINVEGRISEAITRLIHSQQYTVDMMDEAHSEVLQLLYDNIFKKFVRIYHRDMVDIM